MASAQKAAAPEGADRGDDLVVDLLSDEQRARAASSDQWRRSPRERQRCQREALTSANFAGGTQYDEVEYAGLLVSPSFGPRALRAHDIYLPKRACRAPPRSRPGRRSGRFGDLRLPRRTSRFRIYPSFD
jgi:hypothetical protein